MFVYSELMLMTFREYVIDSTITVKRSARDIFAAFRLPSFTLPTLFRSSTLGMIGGLIPAAGGTIASFAAYSLARKLSKRSHEYGKGSIEGVIAAESANNACSGGAIMTTLVLGVPGSVTADVLLGALTMHGLQGRAELRRRAAGPGLRHRRRRDRLGGDHGGRGNFRSL